MLDIYCKDGCCPICNSNLIVTTDKGITLKKCNNDCYRIAYYTDGIDYFGINVFKKTFRSVTDVDLNHLTKKIEKKINYWRENDRYIMKILLSNGSD